eukprot:Pgem_evm2s19742
MILIILTYYVPIVIIAVPMNYVEEENIEEIEIKEEIVVDSDSSSLRAEKSFSTVNSSKPRRDKWVS